MFQMRKDRDTTIRSMLMYVVCLSQKIKDLWYLKGFTNFDELDHFHASQGDTKIIMHQVGSCEMGPFVESCGLFVGDLVTC